MSLRRKFILLIGTGGCAIAFMLPTSAPSLGPIESAAPQYFDSLANFEISTDDDRVSIALRQQASFALVQLQTRTTGSR